VGLLLAWAYLCSAYNSKKFEEKKLISIHTISLQASAIHVAKVWVEKTVPIAKASISGLRMGGYFKFMEW
jgi:hypothetical protein